MGSRIGVIKGAAARLGLTLDAYVERTAAGLKHCTKCRVWKPISEFGADRARWDGRSARCLMHDRVTVRTCTKGRPSTFKGRTHTREAKARMSLAARGRPSGNKGHRWPNERKRRLSITLCAAAKRGPDNHAWKGGVSAEQKRDRKSRGYSSWRREVFRRAGGYCECCQSKHPGRMHAHHIKGFASHPELRLDPGNGSCLCDDCHRQVHSL